MTRGFPTCYLCGASSRQTALKRTGTLTACVSEQKCTDRQAERLANLKAEVAK